MRFQQFSFIFIVLIFCSCSFAAPIAIEPISSKHVSPKQTSPKQASASPQLTFHSAQQCSKCHQEIYDEWSQSWMSKAFSNPVFQQDYARWKKYAIANGEDATSCLRCHAPVAVLTGDMNVAQEGVTCTVCHKVAQVREREGRHYLVMDPRSILYGAADAKSNSVHAIKPSLALSNSTLCAGCHLDVTANGTPLEYTYHEWKNSAYGSSKTQCADCHMPATQNKYKTASAATTHRSHKFSGGHSSSEMLAGAARLRLLPILEQEQLSIEVSNVRVGHSFPTGGAHPSKLILDVTIIAADGKQLFQDSRQYEFTYLNDKGEAVTGREPVASWRDDTLKPYETRVEHFQLPSLSLAGAKFHASLTYQLIPQAIAKTLPADFYQKHYRPVVIDEIYKTFAGFAKN